MKNTLLFASILFVAGLCSCSQNSKTSTTNGSSASPQYYMKGTIKGVAWSSTCIATTYIDYNGNKHLELISGDTSVYPYLFLTIPLSSSDLVGTYTMSIDSSISALGQIDSSNAWRDYSVNGSLTVTAKSPDIVGSCSFTCLDSMKVSLSFACKAP